MAKREFGRPLDFKNGVVELSHGGGGRAMAQLISELFAKEFDNEILNMGDDGGVFNVPPARLVMATDAHVITPLFFPGGDIGSLAIHGTVNDVAMNGAKPLYISCSFIIEEGLALGDLRAIVQSMAKAAREAETPIITGDTKVVEKGKGDGVFITTTGVGLVYEGVSVSGSKVQPGDKIIVSGTLGDHGVAIMSKREGLEFETEIKSDSAALHDLVRVICEASKDIHVLRDPTRGGLASTLNEIARQSKVGLAILEKDIPIRSEVHGACELLGLDPLYVANEGKLICIAPASEAEAVLDAMRAHPQGAQAAIIGEAVEDDHHFVRMKTAFGGERVVDWLTGEQLPRIC